MPKMMNAMRRFATFVMALLVISAGMTVVLLSLTLIPPLESALPGLHFASSVHTLDTWERLIWLGTGMIATALGLLLLVASLSRNDVPKHWIVLQQGGGSDGNKSTVSVSRRAIYALVAHTANRTQGVIDSRPHLRLRRGGWVGHCEVLVRRDGRPVAEVLADVRETLEQTLEEHTGFGVRKLDVRGRFNPFDPRQRVS